MTHGSVAIVLHAHLPFVRHPEHRDHLEERWLFEAIAECYLPLLDVFLRLERDTVPFRCTVSLSPPLVAMLRDPLLVSRFELHMSKIDRLLDREAARTRDDSYIGPVVAFYAARQRALRGLWLAIERDVVGAFARLERAGSLEIWTCGATHAFLPALVHHPGLARAQVALAVQSHRREVGRAPRGMWLPECGYVHGVDAVLRAGGIRYTALETHALTHATPRPPNGAAAPIVTAAGLACFGRDVEASKQVWSKQAGYPGDAYYREFYRDAGYEAPMESVREFVAADGTRQATGLKYYRITGSGHEAKQPYIPGAAVERARVHAADFVANRQKQLRWLADKTTVPPIVLAPYDAELFGHWWFEGPLFLENIFRLLAEQNELAATTLGEYLETEPTHARVEPEPSSWGAGGYSRVWLDPGSGWMLPHVDHVASTLVPLLRAYGRDPGVRGRAARQALREAMLLISSDWAFLIKTGTARHYARARFEAHLARYLRLARMIEERADDTEWLTDVESRDNIFPDPDLGWIDP